MKWLSVTDFVPNFSHNEVKFLAIGLVLEAAAFSYGKLPEMEVRLDFLNLLPLDMSRKILMCFDDVSDIVRASAVSRRWQHLVLGNGLSKHLCFRSFPHLSRVASIVEVMNSEVNGNEEAACSSSRDSKSVQRDHRVYSYLAHASASFLMRNCILEAITASSTDNDPEESITNTLEARDLIARRASYWSSKGHFKPDVSETLIYKLVSNLCVVTEINIRPFQAFFQSGSPIYSSKAVRFRFGHLKHVMDLRSDLAGELHRGSTKEMFTWTYTSPEFPMAQENCLQKFKLPQPVLCIGGILQIELLGRVQRQETDALFYICVSHVQVIGRSLSPAFDIEILEPSWEFILKCNRQAKTYNQLSMLDNEPLTILPTYLERRVIELRQIVNMLRGNVVQGEYYAWGDEEDESDEDFVA
ncbi:F-box protein At4g00755-like isoform X1 [Cucurbita moschata]|uniref:F-box protein At4g00755-like isoform X1 n=2 Tax=Cucurbita moschata TaxID=3662 RepID=A0A6J1E9L6_CUCMO|nr:F-box protein At4g00755-like isoform X1 [Cucurbita moschata]